MKIKWRNHWFRIIPEFDPPAYQRGMRYTRFDEAGLRQQYRKHKPKHKQNHKHV